MDNNVEEAMDRACAIAGELQHRSIALNRHADDLLYDVNKSIDQHPLARALRHFTLQTSRYAR